MVVLPASDKPVTDGVIDAIAETASTAPRAQESIRYVRTEQRQWRDAPRTPPRNKGRRTMGRAGGR